MILDKISQLKKVLILGFAREGQSTFNFLHSRFPNLQIDTADQKDNPDYLKNLQDYQLIIKTPGLSPHKPEIIAAKAKGVIFTSHTQIFFEICSGKIIGVTGTKGKSTTCSLICHVLRATGQPAVLVGNIGKPALDYLSEITPNTWVVMELSSYQLMDMTTSPHVAILQNIYPDHLDYHETFEEYVEAKRNIARFQKPADYFIFNNDFPLPAQTAEITPAHKLPFSLLDYDPKISTRLLGAHNKYNILPAMKIAELLNLPKDAVYQSIASFEPLDTRLQLVGEVKGIRFYEDTLATIPEATIAAIYALHSDVETLIAGGHERKQNYSSLAEKILDSGIKNLIIFPATGPRLAQEVMKQVQSARAQPDAGNDQAAEHLPAAPAIFYTEKMSEAVKFALDHTSPGKICLLSPAAPSFTLFKDYRDEGQQYRDNIEKQKN
jgi:UDP-N-acetylmuramoyl-L-alanine---L-glutamate ligase